MRPPGMPPMMPPNAAGAPPTGFHGWDKHGEPKFSYPNHSALVDPQTSAQSQWHDYTVAAQQQALQAQHDWSKGHAPQGTIVPVPAQPPMPPQPPVAESPYVEGSAFQALHDPNVHQTASSDYWSGNWVGHDKGKGKGGKYAWGKNASRERRWDRERAGSPSKGKKNRSSSPGKWKKNWKGGNGYPGSPNEPGTIYQDPQSQDLMWVPQGSQAQVPDGYQPQALTGMQKPPPPPFPPLPPQGVQPIASPTSASSPTSHPLHEQEIKNKQMLIMTMEQRREDARAALQSKMKEIEHFEHQISTAHTELKLQEQRQLDVKAKAEFKLRGDRVDKILQMLQATHRSAVLSDDLRADVLSLGHKINDWWEVIVSQQPADTNADESMIRGPTSASDISQPQFDFEGAGGDYVDPEIEQCPWMADWDMNMWCSFNQPQPDEYTVDYPDLTAQLSDHQYQMWLLQRKCEDQKVPSRDSMSSVEEDESTLIRNAKSMRLARKIEHDEAMQEHQLPDAIPQAPTSAPGSPSARMRLRANSRCFAKTKDAAVTLNKKEAKEDEETPVLLTKTQKKELKKERKARARSLNASRRKAEEDEFEDALVEAQSAPAPNVMPPPPPPGQPVREVRIELPVVASQSQGETFSDDDPCLEFGNDEPQSGIGDAKAWQDIE